MHGFAVRYYQLRIVMVLQKTSSKVKTNREKFIIILTEPVGLG